MQWDNPWKEAQEERRETRKNIGTVGKIILVSIVAVVVLSVAGIILRAVLLPVHMANKTVDTAYGVVDKVMNADNALSNYEWFKQQYEDYKAIQAKLKKADASITKFEESAGDRDKWTFEDKNEHSRLTTISDGIRYQMEDIKAQYNAKSKMLSRNLFKDKNLPYQLGEE